MADWTVVGGLSVAVCSLLGTVFTVRNAKKVTVVTAAQADAQAERESFRRAQDGLMNRFQSEVDNLHEQIEGLLVRLRAAEGDADEERKKRRTVERDLESVQTQLRRVVRLLRLVPETSNYPELARLLAEEVP